MTVPTLDKATSRLAASGLGLSVAGILTAADAVWAAWSHQVLVIQGAFWFGEPRSYLYLVALAVPSLAGVACGVVALHRMRPYAVPPRLSASANAAIVIGGASILLSAFAVWCIYEIIASIGDLDF
jgi:hypothetical protein